MPSTRPGAAPGAPGCSRGSPAERRCARLAREVRRDALAARDRGPAARGVAPGEILATGPGIHALLSHRVAHALHGAAVPFLPRLLSMFTRAVTGIEIHPAAKIGEGL